MFNPNIETTLVIFSLITRQSKLALRIYPSVIQPSSTSERLQVQELVLSFNLRLNSIYSTHNEFIEKVIRENEKVGGDKRLMEEDEKLLKNMDLS